MIKYSVITLQIIAMIQKNFFKVFLKNKFKDIVSFLTGEIKFFKMVLIILSLPKKKLLFSMFKIN